MLQIKGYFEMWKINTDILWHKERCPIGMEWLGGIWLESRDVKLRSITHLSCPGSLPVGRWGTQPLRGEIWSVIQCPSCRSFKGASACLAGDPPLSNSSIPSSKSTARTSSSLPPWEVGQQTLHDRSVITVGLGWKGKLGFSECKTFSTCIHCQITPIILVIVDISE